MLIFCVFFTFFTLQWKLLLNENGSMAQSQRVCIAHSLSACIMIDEHGNHIIEINVQNNISNNITRAVKWNFFFGNNRKMMYWQMMALFFFPLFPPSSVWLKKGTSTGVNVRVWNVNGIQNSVNEHWTQKKRENEKRSNENQKSTLVSVEQCNCQSVLYTVH